jgi:hypothetical protein
LYNKKNNLAVFTAGILVGLAIPFVKGVVVTTRKMLAHKNDLENAFTDAADTKEGLGAILNGKKTDFIPGIEIDVNVQKDDGSDEVDGSKEAYQPDDENYDENEYLDIEDDSAQPETDCTEPDVE